MTGWEREDKFHGLRREYYPDGKLTVELTYVDGREHGPQLVMHRNGTIWRRGVLRAPELRVMGDHGPSPRLGLQPLTCSVSAP